MRSWTTGPARAVALLGPLLDQPGASGVKLVTLLGTIARRRGRGAEPLRSRAPGPGARRRRVRADPPLPGLRPAELGRGEDPLGPLGCALAGGARTGGPSGDAGRRPGAQGHDASRTSAASWRPWCSGWARRSGGGMRTGRAGRRCSRCLAGGVRPRRRPDRPSAGRRRARRPGRPGRLGPGLDPAPARRDRPDRLALSPDPLHPGDGRRQRGRHAPRRCSAWRWSIPRPSWSDDALLRLVQMDYATRSFDAAARNLERLRQDFPVTPLFAQAAYWAGRTYFDLKDPARACGWLADGMARVRRQPRAAEPARLPVSALRREDRERQRDPDRQRPARQRRPA